MRDFVTRSVLLDGDDIEKKRLEILEYFTKTYEIYERLFDYFDSDDVFYERPEMLRHPLIFYFGHTATFFINKLILAKTIDKRVNPKFESMFAIGVDEMSWDDLDESHYAWPDIDEVRDYRARVKKIIIDLIKNIEFKLPINWDSSMWAILMGIEHEKIHLETSSVLIRQLPIDSVKKSDFFRICQESREQPDNELLDVDGGVVKLGKRFDAHLYGWDNEYGHFYENVESFKASKFLVSNGEFLEFVNDDGYSKSEFWEEEGLKWLNFKKVSYPVFWVKDGDSYKYRTMLEVIDMPLDWPVDVNYHEAKAFCNYKSKKIGKKLRLPSEAEYYRLLDISSLENEPFWDKAPANINLEYFASSTPVDMFKMGSFYDVIGNVWQWSETPISGFDGFKVHKLYDDFSTPTFDNKHNLIKGGSWIATGNEATRESRFAFRRHFYQHAGFRYIESDIEIKIDDFSYENDVDVARECEFNYGDEHFGVKNFAKEASRVILDVMKELPKRRALDLGASVGRVSFELAKEFDFVNGIDFSARFIKVAFTLKEREEVRYIIKDEGELSSYKSKKLKEFDLDKTKNRVEFFQGDPCNLKSQFTNYDLIFLNEVIDRTYNPEKLLKTIHERLNIGGVLIIASSYRWLESNRDIWLGGFKDNTGESITTTFAIEKLLSDRFERVKEPFELEYVFRESRREFKHNLSEFNIFKRVK